MKTKINEALCRATLPTPTDGAAPKRINYIDEKTQGFVLRVSPTAKTFYIYYRDQQTRQPVWIKLGDYDAETFNVEKARNVAKLKLAEATITGIDLRRQKQQLRVNAIAGQKTFSAAVDEYLAECNTRLRTPRVVESALKRPVEVWGNLPCADITDDMCSHLLRPLAQSKPLRANRIQSQLSTFFRWCRQPGRKYVPINPLADCKPFSDKRSVARDHTLTEAELRAVWLALDDPAICAQAKCPRSAALAIKLTIATGLRSGEVVKGKRSELGREKGPVWFIPADRVKLNRIIEQPLNSLAQEIIAEALADDRLVFFPGQSEDGMLCQHSLTYILGGTADGQYPGLYKLLGIRRFRPHDLRRTVSTLINREGSHIPNIREHVEFTLDHIAKSAIGSVYNTNTYLREKRAVLNFWDGELRRIIAGKPARSELEEDKLAA